MITVKVCPQCGKGYTSRCYHDGREVLAVHIPIERADELITKQLEILNRKCPPTTSAA